MATIFGQKNHSCKLKMMMTFMGVKGHMGSNYSKLCSMATKLGQTISYDNDDLHRGQRSTKVKCVNLCYHGYMATTYC